MISIRDPLVPSLVLLVLLGIAGAGPFLPRSNGTASASRFPPHPGGRITGPGGGGSTPKLYEHTVEGGEKQVVFTHRINLPSSTNCGCPPGAEPPAPASEVQALRVKLEALEELVKGLKEQCHGGCCSAAAQAGTGKTDVRSLCSHHGVFDLDRCACSCEPGWAGPTCLDPTGGTVTSSCPEDCNDQGRCVQGRCVCFSGYTGPSCSRPACPGDCRGRGRCVQGVCVCRTGFTGEDCGTRACPKGCSQRGQCKDGKCVCNPGFSGEDCGVRSCPRDCNQKGRCEDGKCVCDPGYNGEDCGVRSCPRDCGDGGRCVDGRCVCWPGYSGEDCSIRTCPRDCHGRGRCEDGECICELGYSGDDCGVRSCPQNCNQRGYCEDGRCVCWPGYTGEDCGSRACPRNCRGRGRCENGACVCNAGYSGIDCGVRTCPGDCLGRGRCENGRCVCWPGYTGRDCGSQTCPGDCRGRGRCQDGHCVCEPGYTGDDCGSRRCPSDCRGHGRCEDGVCVCDRDYTGEDCGQRRCPGDCRGRGRCQDGFCVCDTGYTGEDCGTRSCPRDCSHQGICHDGVCTCWEGFTGEDCSLRTCPENCNHRGQCKNGHCVCEVGYTGPTCGTQTCPGDCQGRGRCVQGVCVCQEGYRGKDCGQRELPAESCSGGCGPRELCRAGQCVCIEGFEGPDCATRTCPGDCRGHGLCQEGSCICHDGYGGEDCGEEIPPITGLSMRLLEETTVRTEWMRASGPVDAYEIRFTPTTEGIGRPFSARVPSSALAYDQRGLSPGQEYQVTVRALRGSNWGPPTSQTITTMIDGPQDLRVTAVTPTTMELSWLRPQAEVDRFVVSYVSAGNQRVRLNVAPEEDRTLLTGLMPGVEYVMTVTAERGRAVSYPASVRANTAPAHHNYQDTRPPAPPPRPPVQPQPQPGLRPDLGPRLPQPVEEEDPKPREVPLGLPPPRFLRNLTSKLGLSWGSVQDVERYLRASGYPLRGNQTYTSVARSIYAYLQRRAGGLSAPPSSLSYKPQSTANLDPDTRKPHSAKDIHGHNPEGVAQVEGRHIPLLPSLLPGPSPRHPKPEVLGSSADGALLVSLDGLRGQFEQVVLRWQPLSPMEGPSREIAVPGATRIARLPGLRPSTTYHVEVHGVQDGQASKSYAFITTTGPFEATDESLLLGLTPPPTTQGAQAPLLKHPVNKPGALSVPPRLGELQVLDVSSNSVNLHWTVPEGRFDSFLVQYKDKNGKPQRVPVEGLQHSVIISPLDPGHNYKFTLYGLEGRKRHGPLTTEAKTSSFPNSEILPRLGELRVTDPTSESLHLSWSVPEGQFDSFLVQYKDRDGQIQVVPVEGPERSITISSLDPSQRYKFILYGLTGKKRHGPLTAEGSTAPLDTESPKPRVGKLIVTDVTQNSLRLLWTILEGKFDSFVVQYKDKDGQPQVVPVEAGQNEVTISDLQPSRKYKMNLYGLLGKQRVGPISVIVTTDPFSVEPHLGEVTVTDVTPDSLRLSWTTKGEFDSFEIQYKDKNGQPKVVSTDGIQDEVTISSLEHSRKYKFLLFGIKDGKHHGPISVEAKTAREEKTPVLPSLVTDALQLPAKPHLGKLMVTNATSDSLQLLWTSPKGQFESFVIQYKNGDGQPKVVHVKGDKNTIIISGLEPDHKYKMNLYGFHDGQRMGPISITGITALHEEMKEIPLPTVSATEAPEPTEKPELGELTVTGATSDSLKLSWTISQGEFDSFIIQYKDRYERPQIVRVGGDQNEVTVSELEPDHRYKMNLYGFHDGQRVGPVSVTGVTAPQEEKTPAPTVPAAEAPVSTEKPELGDLTVIGATPDSLKLFWTISQGEFDSFTIQYKDRDGRPQIVRVEGDQNEVTVSELEPDHRYKMNLYGFHDGHRMGPVSVTGKTAPHEEETPAPTVPATEAPVSTEKPELGDLTVIGATPDSLKLFWTVSQGEFDSFTIQYKDRDGRPQIVRVEGDQNEVIVSELEPDHRYKMNLYGFHNGHRVGPVSVTGKTDQYKVVEQTPAPTVPATEAPVSTEKPELGDVTVVGATPDSLKLFWTVSQGEFDSFTVQYKDRDGRPQIVRVEGDQNEVTVSELEPDHRYKMNLYGFHDGHRVGPVSVTGKTDQYKVVEETPAPPTVPATEAPVSTEKPELGDMTVIGATPDSLKLFWTVSQGEFDSFTIQYKDRDGRPQIMRVEGDQNEVTVSELEPDHRYKMNLYGFHDGHRVGPVSVTGKTAPHEEETPAPTVPATEAPVSTEKPELGDVTVIGATPDSLKLFWTISQGEFDSFTIQYKDRDGRPQIVRVEGDQNEVTVSELEPDHRYKMNLYGFHDGHRVGPVSVTGKTDQYKVVEETPALPTVPATEAPVSTEKPELGDVTVIGATPDSLKLFWTVSQGEFDSFTIQYKDRDGRPQIMRVEGDQNEVTVSELEPDHRYKMNLYGFHDGHRVGPVSVTGKTAPHEEETPAPTVPATEAPVSTEKPELGDVTVIGATPDSLKLFWTISQGEFDSFTIQYKDRDGRPQIVRVEGDQNEVTVSELEPDHRYKMNLYGFHDGHRVGPVSVTGKTDQYKVVEETPAPTVPATEAPVSTEKPELGDVTVIGATPDSLKLFWTVSQGEFDSFTIQYKDRDGRPQIVRVEGDQNEVTVSELEPDHRYKMNLYGFHDGHRVGPVSVTGKTAPHEEETPAPTVPATEAPVSTEKPELGDVTVIGATPDSLKLFWTVSQGEFDSFTIQYKDRDGRPQIVRVEGDQNEVTVSELEPDHRYKMNLYGFHDGHRVGPVSVTGKTAPHEEETPAPTVPATEAPVSTEKPELGDVTVIGATPDSLKLFWTISQGEFDSFTIQYKDRDGRPQIMRVEGDQNEVTVSELEPDHRYKMNLYGFHDGHRVGPVSVTGKTAPRDIESPSKPYLGELTVTDVTQDSLHLTWNILQGSFDSFVIQYKNRDGQPQVVPVAGDQNEITISDLEPSQKYKFLLFGLHNGKRSVPISADAKTLPAVKPAPLLGEMTVTDPTSDSLHLSWTILQGHFDSFVVQYKDKSGQLQVVPVGKDQREITISSLEPNRKYKFLLYGLFGKKRLGPVSTEGTTAPKKEDTQLSPQLGEMKATDATPNSLRLSWTVSQGPFDSFLVQYKDKNGQPQVLPVVGNENEVIVFGLEPKRKYMFLLYGLYDGKRVGPISAQGVTEEETATSLAPATEIPELLMEPRLGILKVTDVAPNSLGLSWTVLQEPFNSFVIQYKDKDGKSQAMLVRGDQKKITISNLEANRKYTFLLYGLYDGKRLGPISTEATTGLAPAGQSPGGRLSQMSVSDVTTSSFRLNWEAPPGAFDSFLLRYGIPEIKPSEPLYPPLLQRELSVPGIQRSAVIRDLRPGTLYAVTLYGLRGPHKADSLQGTARTLSPVLESPRNLKFSEIQENSARVSWTPPPSQVDGFKISYQLADGGEPQSVQVDSHTWHRHLVGLTPGAQYEVTVISVRGFEESEPLTGFLITVPDGPTQLQALNVTDDSALLHWSPPQAPVDRYALRITAPEVPPVMASVPGGHLDFSLHNLQIRTNYTVTLRGFRGPNITSPASITFTTGLDAPHDLKAKEVTPRSALLTWTEPESPPSGYLLSYNTPGEQTKEILLPGGVTSHQLSGLFPSTLYNAWIQAIRGESLTPPVPTTFTTGGLRIPFPRDCGEEVQNGLHHSRKTTIFLNGNRERPLEVYCDMETDGGGWLVFQRRMDGHTDFWRDWAEYAHGFGNISGEFWLGNEALHSLTQAGDYSLRVDLRAGNESVFAEYDFFTVDSAAKYYRLHLEGYHGTAGDSMSYHSGSIFSTRDRDPNNLHIPCAVSYRGGWWYRNCHYVNLNGLYGSIIDHQGVSWYAWKGFEFSIPFTEMKLRPRSYNPSSQRA
ncbi:tenascin-X isoform X1 [Sarcophilus harrisii]|uniref:tenascin-X isoform X1 n=2 Tax=Sarcophilus harrisii TaxID=9305 RepID=UPI001301C487|nr:tenascin-X isoform X1 [Sarcophilus harrisii]